MPNTVKFITAAAYATAVAANNPVTVGTIVADSATGVILGIVNADGKLNMAPGRVGPITNATSASIATLTVGGADASFLVSANCNVTTSTTHSFSLNVLYTDESNTSRVLVLPVAQLAGTFVTTGLITAVTGVGPYESAVMHIRCKAATTITIQTSSGGTYTTVVYTAEGLIRQVG